MYGRCATLVLLPAAAAACASRQPDTDEALVARARQIHERVITIDTHDDIPFNFGSAGVNPCQTLQRQVDIPKMRAGGLDVAFFIVYVGQGPRTPEGNDTARVRALQKFEGIHRVAEHLCPDQIEIAYRADDVARIARSGKLVAAIGIENGYVIGRDLALLKRYHELGARYITLAHGGHNDIADSATPRANEPPSEHDGLSAFGEQVVAEMNQLGIMVDVSHISKAAALDAMRVSRAPVIASHSSTRVIANHPRNMDDETLLALQRNGGVMQTVGLAGYVKVAPPERTQAMQQLREEFGLTGGRGAAGGGGRAGGGRGAQAALAQLTPERRAEYDRRMADIDRRWPFPPANVEDFVDHIDHAVKLIGIDHVGISSDFDGGGGIEGWGDASESFNVTLEMVRRGYDEDDIAKIWGGNLLRVWREVERVAARPASTEPSAN